MKQTLWLLCSFLWGYVLTGCGPLTQKEADELQRQVRDQQARLAVLEQDNEKYRKANIVDRTDQAVRAQADTTAEIRRLQEHIAGLEGQIAELKHSAATSHAVQSELPAFVPPGSVAVSPQVSQPSAGGSSAGSSSVPPSSPLLAVPSSSTIESTAVAPAPAADAKELFASGKQSYDQGDYATARMRFRDYLGRFPSEPEADDAQYWIGASYLAQERPASALGELRKVTEKYPKSNVLDLALLDMAECFFRLRACDDAKIALQTLLRSKPSASVASKAEQKLKQISKAPRESCLR